MGIYKKDNSPYWHYSFKLSGRSQVRGSTGYAVGKGEKWNKDLALAFYIKARAEAKEMVDFKKPSKMTVHELLEWTNKNHWHYEKWETVVRAILNNFGSKKASQISFSDIMEFKAERFTKVCEETVNRDLTYFSAAYNYAIKAKLLFENPIKNIDKFDCTHRQRVKFLNPQEKMQLVNAATGQLQDLIVFALQTGMRQGEILGLKWQDVDFNLMHMRVLRKKGGSAIFSHVPIWDKVQSIILAQPRRGEFVFTRLDGSRLGKNSCAHSTYRRLIKRLNIQGGDFTFHDLRHNFASDYLMAGNTLASLAEILGHRRFDTTRRYAHLSREHHKAGMDRMPRLVYERARDVSLERNYHTGITLDSAARTETPKMIESEVLGL